MLDRLFERRSPVQEASSSMAMRPNNALPTRTPFFSSLGSLYAHCGPRFWVWLGESPSVWRARRMSTFPQMDRRNCDPDSRDWSPWAVLRVRAQQSADRIDECACWIAACGLGR